MIQYQPDPWGILFAFKLRGSVLPKSFGFALACSISCVVMHVLLQNSSLKDELNVADKGASVLGSFTFILGFLIVFRTQKSYDRWWEGGSLLQELRGEWFNAYSCLLAFSNPAEDKKDQVAKFQHQLARLVSMLYGAGLAQVASLPEKHFEVIDLEDFDRDCLRFVDGAHDACEVVLQWIQRLIVEAEAKQTIKVAPPILSRVYNQLGNGIVKLNNARKISNFPFPFPFAQMVTLMLLIHWVLAAIICATSVRSPVWAGLISFAVIISFWSINFIALELENPFGDDLNDLPIREMQCELNKSLLELLKPLAMKAPGFNFNKAYHGQVKRKSINFGKGIEDSAEQAIKERGVDAFTKAEQSEKTNGTVPAICDTSIPPPVVPAPPITAAPPAAVAKASPASQPPPAAIAQPGSKGDASKEVAFQKNAMALVDAEQLQMGSRMESLMSAIASKLERLIDSHSNLYKLICDLYGGYLEIHHTNLHGRDSANHGGLQESNGDSFESTRLWQSAVPCREDERVVDADPVVLGRCCASDATELV